MKKIFLFSAMAVLMMSSVVTLNSCKKGADDPSISLRSRTSRLAGKWTISTGNTTTTNNNGGSTSTSTTTIAGTTETIVANNNTSIGTVEYTIEFLKDGTYTSVMNETFTGYSSKVTSNGTWNFVAGGNDLNNKEAVILNQLQSTDVTTIGSSSSTTVTSTPKSSSVSIWKITRLANKELVVTSDDSYSSGSNNSTTTSTMTFVQ